MEDNSKNDIHSRLKNISLSTCASPLKKKNEEKVTKFKEIENVNLI